MTLKKLSSLTLVAAVLLSAPALAQIPTILVADNQPFVPLSGPGVQSVTFTAYASYRAEDEGVYTVTLPFQFPYFGTNYNSVDIVTNGLLTLGTVCTSSSSCFSNQSFPSTSAPNNVIAGFWDDLDAVAPGSVKYLVSSSELTVEFSNVQLLASSGSTVTFQIKLSASGSIVIHHGSITGTASSFSASVGFENAGGTLGANLINNIAGTTSCTSSCGTGNWVANRQFRIGEPIEADLAVSSVSLANFVAQGDGNLNFDVTARLRNFGKTDANNFMWRAYLSRDLLLDTTATDGGADIQVAEGGPVSLPGVDGGFAPDGGLAIIDVTGPAFTTTAPPTGEYYVLVQVDSSDVVMEASEANNVGSTANSFVQGADLVATSVSGPATTGGGNVENIPVSFYNRGSVDAGTVGFRLLLSTDQLLDQSDYQIFPSDAGDNATRFLGSFAPDGGGNSVTETISVTMPAGVPNGQFYYLLQVDPQNALVEANENNNVAASTAKVDVRRADLLAEAVTFVDPVTNLPTTNARFGEAVRMKVRFRNSGGANANNFRVGMVLSTDSSLSLLSDTYVCDSTVAQVVPSTTSTEVTLDCNLPLTRSGNAFATGQYFLFGIVDSTGAVFESNKANNSLQVGPIRITAPGPDLTVSSVTAPASAGVGEVIPVVRTLRNIGNLDATLPVKYRFYASANDIITTDDVLLQIIENGGARDEGSITLARGASDTATELVRLPGTMPAGTYYVGCVIDPTFVIANDLDPTNNALASRTMVVAPSSLRVVNTTLPDAIIGRPYSFRLAAVGEQGASTWRIDTSLGAAPSWLSIGATDGLLSGTPTGSTGAEVVGVTVVLENAGRQAAVRLALRVLPTTGGLDITTTSLPAVVNSSASQYQYVLGAAGGVRPYSWRLAGGTLPTGMALQADGTLFGAPRNASPGSTPITIEVRDAVGGRATRQLSLRLIAPGAITFRTVSIPDALIGQEYLQDIAVANQDGSMLAKPLTWRVSGEVPGGLSVTPQAELITVSGRATQAGTFTFSITVEDNNGRTDSLEFTMTVHPSRYRVLAMFPDVLRPGQESVSLQLSVSPNNPAATYRLVTGLLPPGLTLDSAGLISGTVASEGSEGIWSFIVEARDPNGMSGLTPFSLRVEREARAVGCSSTSTDWSPLALLVVGALWLFRRRGPALRLSGALAALVALVPAATWAQDGGVVYQIAGPTPVAYQPLTNGAVTSAGASLTVPFQVPFFDTQFNTVSMSQYGYLAIGGAYVNSSNNQNVPHNSTSSFQPVQFIAPWWDSLTTPLTSSNGYRYQVTGVTPNRIMAFEWNAVGANSTANRVAFQVLIYETTGRIRFVYSSALPSGSSASVGVQKALTVGTAALTCSTSASCSSSAYPAGQAIDLFLPPDLEVTTLSAPQLGYKGVAYPQTATIRNKGGREATGVSVRFYLSTDASLDPMLDTVIGTATIPSIDAQATAQATLNSPLPASLTGSSYFVFAVVDPDRTIVEQVETNNVSAPSVLTIGPPTADLIVGSFSAPTAAMPGATLQVTRTLQNIGNADSAAAKYTYFLSDNASVSIADRSLSVGQVGVLTAGQQDTGMDSITIPSDLPPANYWLGLCANYDGATSAFGGSEITIVNNCFTQVAAVQVSTGSVAVATTALPAATQYAPFGLRLQATGGTGVYTWELASGTLPPGLALSTAGDLGGSPSSAGSFSFDVKVTSGSLSDTRSLSLQVAAGGLPLVIVDQVLTAAQFGRAFNASLVAVGGKPPYTWRALDAAELPPGVGVATDGLVEGRPLMAGDFTFGVEVKDSTGTAVSKEVSVRVVTPTSLSISTSAIEPASVGREYLQPLVAVGGTAPYAWSLIRFQELPENITEAPGAVVFNNGMPVEFPADFGIGIDDRDTSDYLSGTPRKAGLYALTLKVKDGADTEDTASVLLRISYRDGLAITTLQLPDAFVNQPYQVRLSHNGGSDAVGISFTAGCIQQAVRPGEFECAAADALQKLPVGLSLSPDGTIVGTPLADTGTYTFLVKLTDGQGRQDVRALGLRLRPDFSLDRAGCSGTGLDPSLLALALVGLAFRRRNR